MAGLAVLAGCNRSDDHITVYRIPKETPPDSMAQQASMPQPASVSQGAADVHWTAPSGWEEQPASGFRKGSYLVKGADGETADVSVISFPEAAGGLMANINRWRDQLKLPPVSNAADAATPMSVSGRDMFFVDLVSEQPVGENGSKTRILGGIFPVPGETWFFKMMGPDQLVESQRDNFKQFLQSVHAAEPTAAADGAPPVSAPRNATSGGTNTNAPTPPLIAPPEGGTLQYTLPSSWKEKPLSPMRLASFDATAPDGKVADISIVSLPVIAGGDLANVNRWRGQVKLDPINEDTLAKTAEHVKADGHDYLVVNMVSPAPMGDKAEKQWILAAILDENGRAWFIKMMGEDQAVESQKTAFLDFLRSLKIP